MQTIKETYSIVTPMFIGGADQNPTDGIRPPSFKGALRFWWRAMNWGKFRNKENANDKSKNDESALVAMHAEESRLFGTAARKTKDDEQLGQGCFLLTIDGNFDNKNDLPSSRGTKYLGYGLMGSNNEPPRGYLEDNQIFTVSLVFKHKADKSIIAALKTLGLLGGLGSRSRVNTRCGTSL